MSTALSTRPIMEATGTFFLLPSGAYHFVTRGINRQDIFCDQDDYQRFLGNLDRVKIDRFELYGYCLMSNHVHLLIHDINAEKTLVFKDYKILNKNL
ncbi:hypothetical protein HX99_03845 [Peptococcaceae bacterium SCADC1_2_3]|nr:hypothetical protein DK28_0201685 [Peptococcaceae bacterium SCADC1_2_3]KFI37048.1 hypothetical protein HX99_03845 [Peptococcaceae bacterium SCADC1_2_3]